MRLLFFFLLGFFIPVISFASVVATTDSVDASAFQTTLISVFSAIAAVLVLFAFMSLAIKWVLGFIRR